MSKVTSMLVYGPDWSDGLTPAAAAREEGTTIVVTTFDNGYAVKVCRDKQCQVTHVWVVYPDGCSRSVEDNDAERVLKVVSEF